jgi:hypothetical protein
VPAVPHRRCSYAALRLPEFFGLGSGSPCLRPTTVWVSFLGRLQHVPPTPGRPRFASCWLPWAVFPWKHQGLPGYWVVLFGRAGFEHPVQARSDSPSCVALVPPSAALTAWAPGNGYFGAECSGPHACLPTHRLRCCCHRRKAGYRPAGLRFGRVGFAPTGRRSGFQGLIVSPFPPGQHCLVAPAVSGQLHRDPTGRSLMVETGSSRVPYPSTALAYPPSGAGTFEPFGLMAQEVPHSGQFFSPEGAGARPW